MILGKTGKNFGAGMSGGLAYIYDPERRMPDMCNEDVAGDLLPLADVEVLPCTLPDCSSKYPFSACVLLAPVQSSFSALLHQAAQWWPRTWVLPGHSVTCKPWGLKVRQTPLPSQEFEEVC